MTVMVILFLSETAAFVRTKFVTRVAVDETRETRIRVNFNITFLELPCDYVSVDVWDALGTNRQNVTKNVEKWKLNDENDDNRRRVLAGVDLGYAATERELKHDEHDDNMDFHQLLHVMQNEHHAVELTKENFHQFLEEHEMVFIDMFAPWYVVSLLLYFAHHGVCWCCFLSGGCFFSFSVGCMILTTGFSLVVVAIATLHEILCLLANTGRGWCVFGLFLLLLFPSFGYRFDSFSSVL